MQISSNPAITSPASEAMFVLSVSGMNCENCVQSVEQQLRQQPGIISVTVDLANAMATVECESGVDPVVLARRLTEAGFPSQTQQPETEIVNDKQVQWPLMGFHLLAVVFNLCLVAQVLTVGLAYFYNPEWWKAHVWLVRGYGGLSLILLAWVYLIPFPRRVRSLTASMPVLLGLQFLTIHLKTAIPLAIVHPLLGFTLFSVSTTLVHRVGRVISPRAEEEAN